MSAATHPAPRIARSDRLHVRRTRGALSGVLLVVLGAWGALIPFVGPYFNYAYTPNNTWDFTSGRLWLEILPGAATALGGLVLLMSGNRVTLMAGGWLAAIAGLWFTVGPALSTLWNHGATAGGVPTGVGSVRTAVEQIGFFTGLGAVIALVAAFAIGRMTIVGVADVEHRNSDA
jgi:hypothetical protein